MASPRGSWTQKMRAAFSRAVFEHSVVPDGERSAGPDAMPPMGTQAGLPPRSSDMRAIWTWNSWIFAAYGPCFPRSTPVQIKSALSLATSSGLLENQSVAERTFANASASFGVSAFTTMCSAVMASRTVSATSSETISSNLRECASSAAFLSASESSLDERTSMVYPSKIGTYRQPAS